MLMLMLMVVVKPHCLQHALLRLQLLLALQMLVPGC
jgi:hypothetical protein